MLGKLALYLRMLGIDTDYTQSKYFDLKVDRAKEENRVFLTRDTKILKMKNMPIYYFVKNNFPEMQLFEVLDELQISLSDLKPFSRCLRCNTVLRMIPKSEVFGRVPDYVFQHQYHFSYCSTCNSIYWQGTHYERMKNLVEKITMKLKKD